MGFSQKSLAIFSDGRASVFRALGGLEPSVFIYFGLRADSGSAGRAKFASYGQASKSGSVPDPSQDSRIFLLLIGFCRSTMAW